MEYKKQNRKITEHNGWGKSRAKVEQIRELEYRVGKVPDGRRKRKKESENKKRCGRYT